jgi:hypothetical protein
MADNKLDSGQGLVSGLAGNLASNIDGIFSIKPMAKYLSGARCTLKINGKIIGFAFGISWNIETSVTEINTIDDPLAYELAPCNISVTGQISGFRIPGSGPGQMLIQGDVLSFVHQRYVEIEVRDTQTDNLIFLTKKAMITSRSENIRSDALAEMTLNFKAIGFADERTPKLPDGVGDSVSATGINPLTSLTNKVKNALKL